MLNDSEFHRLADATLAALSDALENADAGGVLDVELQGGVLTLGLQAGKTLVVSKHGPSKQVWYSSPISGGLHFPYAEGRWVLADGRELLTLVAQEVKALSGVEMA
ncbi:MAG: iron donor protein CyaY [Rickettsiales bacterium]|nr:iron donor protein CyaY [Rickettsiales bacterium]